MTQATMAQFDVFVNPIRAARAAYPFVVAMQSDLAATTYQYQLVAPIAAAGTLTGGRLTPAIALQGRQHVVLVPQVGVMRTRDLSASVSSIAQHRGELLAAIDLLFFGV